MGCIQTQMRRSIQQVWVWVRPTEPVGKSEGLEWWMRDDVGKVFSSKTMRIFVSFRLCNAISYWFSCAKLTKKSAAIHSIQKRKGKSERIAYGINIKGSCSYSRHMPAFPVERQHVQNRIMKCPETGRVLRPETLISPSHFSKSCLESHLILSTFLPGSPPTNHMIMSLFWTPSPPHSLLAVTLFHSKCRIITVAECKFHHPDYISTVSNLKSEIFYYYYVYLCSEVPKDTGIENKRSWERQTHPLLLCLGTAAGNLRAENRMGKPHLVSQLFPVPKGQSSTYTFKRVLDDTLEF